MRDLILNRLNELREYHNGFPSGTMRWKNFTLDINGKPFPIQYIVFHQLTDEELTVAFERILRRHYTQM